MSQLRYLDDVVGCCNSDFVELRISPAHYSRLDATSLPLC
jgi:hypothetical protein